MLRVSLALCLTFVVLSAGEEAERYEGYQLLGVELESHQTEEANFLRELREERPELDFWLDPVAGHRSNVLVPPPLLSEFKSRLESRNLQYEILSDDVQGLVNAGSAPAPEDGDRMSRASSGYIIDHGSYHSYNQIINYIHRLKNQYPYNVAYSNLNHRTHDNRSVIMVELKGDGGSSHKPAIIVEAGIHAREWISPAANLYLMEKLLQDYTANKATAKQMLDKYNWYIVPVTNPDGYEYTKTNRMWRKNRRPISNSCSGVDLNRNFDSKFGEVGVSSNCRSDVYPGTNAFSEPETKNMRDLYTSVSSKVKAYISVHSYSQVLLVPWGYVNYYSRPENRFELDRVGNMMTETLGDTHDMYYQYGTAPQLLGGGASGASEDWALLQNPSLYAYCYELRPGRYSSTGFLLPASQIVAQGEEYYASLAVLSKEMKI